MYRCVFCGWLETITLFIISAFEAAPLKQWPVVISLGFTLSKIMSYLLLNSYENTS